VKLGDMSEMGDSNRGDFGPKLTVNFFSAITPPQRQKKVGELEKR